MCYRYLIEGRVQGVFYRASAKQAADRCGIRGWVRNLSDGRVESFACGDEQQLREFEKWLHEGPRLALVNVVTKNVAPCEETPGFEMRPTA